MKRFLILFMLLGVMVRSVATAQAKLWHGALDDDIPTGQVRGLATRLPRATLLVWPRYGYGMPRDAMRAVHALLI